MDRITDAGAREVEAVRIEPSLYIPSAAAERVLEPEAAIPPGPLNVITLDLPLADGSADDHRPRLAVSADPWPGNVAVMKSADGEGFDLAATVTTPAIIGQSDTTLPAGNPARWQRVDWGILMPSGGLSSADRLAVLNGANRLAVEHPSGDWEVLQFRDALMTGVDSYTLGNLLRGQRGTGHLSQAELPAGTRIVVLDSSLVPLPIGIEELGLERSWKVGPAQFDISHPAYVAFSAAFAGNGLSPFAPAHLRADSQGADLLFTWVRTTRIGGDSLQVVEVPMAEDVETYRLTIRAGATTVRTADVTSPAFTYTAAMQAADGVAGTLQIGVSQLSTTVGYGPERVVEIDV